ncbi:transposase, partial [Metabacillus litoralis]|nr:transposase [Metabacillus litoralis]
MKNKIVYGQNAKISIKSLENQLKTRDFCMYFTYSNVEIEENRKFYEMMYDASHHLVKIDRV